MDPERHRPRERRPRPTSDPRRRGLLVALLVSAATPAGCGGEPERAGPAPNVVVYLVDTLRKDHLSVYGYPRETSPRLAEFAKDAVRFETAYSPTSWTRPAVASLLTGVTPPRHGAISRPDRLDPEARLLPEHLRAAGYHSAAFVSNPNVLPVWGFAKGFDDFHDAAAARAEARADEINAAVFRHLEEKRREPFFLYVHTIDPHQPYEPLAEFAGLFPRPSPEELSSADPAAAARARLTAIGAAYDAEIRFNDHCFGALLDFLSKAGFYDDALVVFTSDHGEEFRDHGELGHGSTLYEEVVQVPLLVKLPRGEHAGRVVHTPASLLDLLPTIVRFAGLPAVEVAEGLDLLELLRAEDSGRSPARPLFLDLDLTGVTPERIVVSGVVSGSYKLLDAREPRRAVALFDLRADPEERTNAALREPALARQLRGVLAEHRARTDAGVHLWLVNANDQRTRTVKGALRSAGRFQGLRALQLEKGDTASLREDGRRLVFELTLRNRPNPIAESPRRLVDHDRLLFSVDPPDAATDVETLEIDGEPAPIFLGRDAHPATGAPFALDLGALDLRGKRMENLFPATEEASSVAALGAYLGVVRRARVPPVVLDAAVEERLRALGYAN